MGLDNFGPQSAPVPIPGVWLTRAENVGLLPPSPRLKSKRSGSLSGFEPGSSGRMENFEPFPAAMEVHDGSELTQLTADIGGCLFLAHNVP